MSTALQLRRGTTAQHAAFTGAEGEVTVDTTKGTLVIHDGATAGGFALARESSTQATLVSGMNIKSINGDSVLGSGNLVVDGPQIQPISAAVGSNALTISASALVLDFRSTTLGSGTVTRVAGTPADLVISSGSTLGTISGQQSRIAVLALNNAGTIELAAVNVAGGNNLSETGLISTTAEGGAGAADSASVVYSTTARTNVAYRVIGYVESTQATAGTWATAPSTIQGAGGNAVTAMSSLGYSQTWQNVAGSRAAATTYYNTTGKPIQAIVALASSVASWTPQLTIGGVLVSGSTQRTAGDTGHMSFIVPPGVAYSITATAGTPSVNSWLELR